MPMTIPEKIDFLLNSFVALYGGHYLDRLVLVTISSIPTFTGDARHHLSLQVGRALLR